MVDGQDKEKPRADPKAQFRRVDWIFQLNVSQPLPRERCRFSDWPNLGNPKFGAGVSHDLAQKRSVHLCWNVWTGITGATKPRNSPDGLYTAVCLLDAPRSPSHCAAWR
jgi:hypothetical protein